MHLDKDLIAIVNLKWFFWKIKMIVYSLFFKELTKIFLDKIIVGMNLFNFIFYNINFFCSFLDHYLNKKKKNNSIEFKPNYLRPFP